MVQDSEAVLAVRQYGADVHRDELGPPLRREAELGRQGGEDDAGEFLYMTWMTSTAPRRRGFKITVVRPTG